MTYVLSWRPAMQMDEIAQAPFDVWREDDGQPSTMFHRTESGFLLRFLEGGDFEIDLNARRVICTPIPGAPEDYIRNIFSNQILPLLSTYDGTPVLHASCVVIAGGAYGFLGRSGRGKSTMAAAFARYGHAFLTDDGMVIEEISGQVQVRPYLPSIRLLPDSQGAIFGEDAVTEAPDDGWAPKARIDATDAVPHADKPVPLRAIYVLEEPLANHAVVTPLSASASLDALLKNSFLLDSRDKVRVRAHFRAMAELANAFPMFALDYPRDFSRLEETVATIALHAKKQGSPE